MIVVLLLSSGCSVLPREFQLVEGELPDNFLGCQKVFENIKKKWASKDSFPFVKYYYNEGLLNNFELNEECFIGLTNEQIENFLGEPNCQEGIICYKLYGKSIDKSRLEIKYVLYFYLSEGANLVERIDVERVYLVN